MENQSNHNERPTILNKPTNYKNLNFYKRSLVLYQLTIVFTQRFFKQSGDRTVDQMVQAARSAKQNIAEGCADGLTSSESEIKLLGVARGSNQELLEDYLDYLSKHRLIEWKGTNPQFDNLYRFCREHTELPDYYSIFEKGSDEKMANCAICLAHMIDKGLTTFLQKKDADFVKNGGMRERMTAARLQYRNNLQAQIQMLMNENQYLRAENARLMSLLSVSGNAGSPK